MSAFGTKVICAALAFVLAGATPPPYVAAPGETDVLGRPLSDVFSRGVPVLVLYANQDTEDSTDVPATELAVRVQHDMPFVTIVRIDLRGVPGFVAGIAHSIVKGEHAKSMKRYDRQRAKLGYPPVPEPEKTLYLVPDDDGRAHSAAGLPKGFQTALAVVLAPDGHEIFRGPFPADSAKVEAALRSAGTPR